MILGTDFRFRDEYKNDTTAIELLTQSYKGVIYRYTKVAIKEPEDGTAVLQFEYEIINPSSFEESKLRNDKYFQEHLGLILNTLILDVAEIENDEARTNNSEKSTEE